ncbi:MAG: mobile mystery protein B [Gammaproteobacteria bacterium]|nr:mobile mystery protein B [Gammaproteobacteria bacterium]
MRFVYPFDATPLDSNESEGLIPKHIVTLSQLNEWEQANILEAELWLSKHHYHFSEITTIDFVQKLHQKMFNQTWKWAGQFRRTNKNIGDDWSIISENLKKLLDDVQYQVNHFVYHADEIATRFHHRLVAIHIFPNGNGRHARIITDVLLLSLGQSRFSWGQKSISDLYEPTLVRKQYINALKAADQHDYQPLFDFIRK